MIPIVLDGARVTAALVGRGAPLMARLRWLREARAARLTVYSDAPTSALRRELGPALVERLPTTAELAAVKLVWITGLSTELAGALAARARRVGALANVEDVADCCEFHTPAVVRRGDLLLTVSTAGRCPGLASRMRAWLEGQFGPEWAGRTDLLAAKRTAWRRKPRSLPELAALSDAVIDRRGWLAEEAHW